MKIFCIISLCTSLVFILFASIHASSVYDEISASKLMDTFLGSKKGDKVKGLNQIRNYLSRYGYFNQSWTGQYQRSYDTKNDDSNIIDHAFEEAIQKFQLFYHLNVSGILDEKTLSLMAKPRCNFPDLVNGTRINNGMNLVRGPFKSFYQISNKKWTKYKLSWGLRPGTRTDVLAPITSAFARWASVSPFRFRHKNSSSLPDVKISFYSGPHGDSFPFHGRDDESPAHSSLPETGKMHFNEDSPWVIGEHPESWDIESVALHELGHILGLLHSEVQDAIMWPYTAKGVTKLNIHEDDIQGMRELYNYR